MVKKHQGEEDEDAGGASSSTTSSGDDASGGRDGRFVASDTGRGDTTAAARTTTTRKRNLVDMLLVLTTPDTNREAPEPKEGADEEQGETERVVLQKTASSSSPRSTDDGGGGAGYDGRASSPLRHEYVQEVEKIGSLLGITTSAKRNESSLEPQQQEQTGHFHPPKKGECKNASYPHGKSHIHSHETMIARELYMLTSEERQRILHDLHGVSDDIISRPRFHEENQGVVDKALDDLQELRDHERLRADNTLLRLAEEQYPERMNSRDFLLMFLRANEFKPRIAMDRILLHLEQHRQLFGEAKVGKQITMNDLSTSDKRALESGQLQLLPENDQSGRLIVFVDTVAAAVWRIDNNHREISVDSMLRVAYYVLMAGLEDNEKAQECGVVIVLSHLGDGMVSRCPGARTTDNLPAEVALLMEGAARLFQGLPLKLRALHACLKPHASSDEGFYVLQRFLTTDCRVRSRIHRGSLAECRSALNAFGIPSSRVPLNDSLTIVREQHLNWMRYREEIESFVGSSNARSLILLPSPRGMPSSGGNGEEEDDGSATAPTTSTSTSWNSEGAAAAAATAATDDDIVSSVGVRRSFLDDVDCASQQQLVAAGTAMIATPSRQDVLFGRGQPIQEHPGNILLNSLVEAVREKRESLTRRRDKTMISQMIVTKVKQAGGRFLKQSTKYPNMWEEADDEAAQDKVSHTFRSLRQSQRLREESEAAETGKKSETKKEFDEEQSK